ncbi:hypothetical protein PCA01_36410 [Pseudoalteromonas carrageenovora]|nr:hypothetical protein PCA01_36410 [Pseudoalteromonas carrageenovora]
MAIVGSVTAHKPMANNELSLKCIKILKTLNYVVVFGILKLNGHNMQKF